jgi:polysaccharide export outer membrane protein
MTFTDKRRLTGPMGRTLLGSFILLIFISCAANPPTDPVVKPLVIENHQAEPKASELILDRAIIIGPSGKINMPLAGEIGASGLTVSKLRLEITKRLSKFINDPMVSVNVTTIASQKVHVMGEVRSPGTFMYIERMPVWEAVSTAGGFTDDANSKNLLLVRVKDREASISVISLDFEKVFEEGKIKGDYYLKNGDVLYVVEKKIANAENFMMRLSNIIAPIYTIQRMITIWPNLIDALEGNRGNVTVTP